MPRLQRLTDFIARLLGKEWDVRALDHQRDHRPGGHQDNQPSPPVSRQRHQDRYPAAPADSVDSAETADAADAAGPDDSPFPPASEKTVESVGSADPPDAAGRSDRSSERAKATASAQTSDASRTWSSRSGRPNDHLASSGVVADGSRGEEWSEESTEPLTLARIESMLTGPMEYHVQLADDREHPCLLGTWDSFPFVIEIPEGHDGWLLVSGDWEEAAPVSQRDEIAASVNDWNRDKFFPTVGVVDTAIGPLVRATYLTDLSAGVTDAQLRLHLDTALSACTQALSLVGPLLPEI
ncbi:YbjN domain-containing protein [Actinomyces naeslundii]|uniref:Histidine kinase n=3 Tax=Actinomyces naeslundii TaxID=1655 RepID=A0A854DAK2_ACTNA|nr:YbjN domain-containing protein [Actinomyces naeslundii]OMG21435.1 histidine kinase [Actinomyces naeslundii]OMG27760.1 histidine kinase [Actinomyces naeslundii]OMG31500.1 histidine kinase [Actinomyces naeslundii]OMG37633.1 histidine kinase [Actinomyces naeslundii]QQC20478.1 YbjN domain-containing protein [Actinomyces naeslundii]